METMISIPKEEDFRRWIKEELNILLIKLKKKRAPFRESNLLISRIETAKMLGISLVTLMDWVKRGLPHHKHRGRVYFIKMEMLDYLKKNSSN